MNPRLLLCTLAVAAVAGCAGRTPSTEIPTDHPGHPAAAPAPAPARSDALRDRATASRGPSGATQPATAAAVVYTCPHHPEVTSSEPGVCPKCDMKLQPTKVESGNAPPAGGAGHGGH